jgi:4'-phosphopantetheinyl transferase
MLPCLPKDYSLPDDEVHVWQTRLDLSRNHIEGLREILSVDEQQRADRFHVDRDRKHHIIARGLLRLIIARLSNTSPELLKITGARHGKPYLLHADQPRIEFNISHSEELIYVAIANSRAVGIDVERVRGDFPLEEIASDTLSKIEFKDFTSLDPTSRRDGFFTYWTRKEALLKASGKGLSASSSPCSRSLFGHLPTPVDIAGFEGHPVTGWTLLDLETDVGYKAALAFEGGDCHVRRWNWPVIG